jgi:hypothetical protein
MNPGAFEPSNWGVTQTPPTYSTSSGAYPVTSYHRTGALCGEWSRCDAWWSAQSIQFTGSGVGSITSQAYFLGCFPVTGPTRYLSIPLPP